MPKQLLLALSISALAFGRPAPAAEDAPRPNIIYILADDNDAVDWHARFPAVTTDRLRLVGTRTPGNLTRIWELEVYGPVAAGQ